MSCGLLLRVEKDLGGRDVPGKGVVANVYALDPEKKENTKRNLTIPIGYGMTYESVELEPGAYLIEAILPAGDILTEQMELREGEWRTVKLDAEPSAHEWQGWHNLLGMVESHDLYYKAYTLSGGLLDETPAPEKPPQFQVWLLKEPVHEEQFDLKAAHELWQRFDGELEKFLRFSPAHQIEPIKPIDWDADSAVYPFDKPTLRFEQRWYAVIESGDTVKLAVVPSPWYDLETGQDLPPDLFVRQTAEGKIEAAFSVADKEIGTALGYLARGAMQSAAQIIGQERAMEMLYGKMTNPLAAAAGGYILIGAQKLAGDERWLNWVENLMNWFPWLPDGAIQRAWALLRLPASIKHRKEARDALFTAYNRGLPYYTLGLQWLLDGLTLIGEEYEEAQEMLRNVQKVAWRADMSNPFTTITLSR